MVEYSVKMLSFKAMMSPTNFLLAVANLSMYGCALFLNLLNMTNLLKKPCDSLPLRYSPFFFLKISSTTLAYFSYRFPRDMSLTISSLLSVSSRTSAS